MRMGIYQGIFSAAAQETDPRWRPWLGCWQLWEEQLDPSTLTTSEETAALLDRTRVCVRPGGTGDSVDLTAVAGHRILVERTLTADGTRREMEVLYLGLARCPDRAVDRGLFETSAARLLMVNNND